LWFSGGRAVLTFYWSSSRAEPWLWTRWLAILGPRGRRQRVGGGGRPGGSAEDIVCVIKCVVAFSPDAPHNGPIGFDVTVEGFVPRGGCFIVTRTTVGGRACAGALLCGIGRAAPPETRAVCRRQRFFRSGSSTAVSTAVLRFLRWPGDRWRTMRYRVLFVRGVIVLGVIFYLRRVHGFIGFNRVKLIKTPTTARGY